MIRIDIEQQVVMLLDMFGEKCDVCRDCAILYTYVGSFRFCLCFFAFVMSVYDAFHAFYAFHVI